MKTVAVTFVEGGVWVDWRASENVGWRSVPRTVHSIKFESGDIWDAVNGWRQKPSDQT